ncbi:MAG TPA: serine/threonine-protein kinase [Verrucomicrobiae bacterium]|nr:serine/threonine-protein kinase [Verrucomicrobiae bacterium]
MENRFGDYVLLGKLGEGDMGEIWNARQESENRHVTLRRIKPGYFTSVADIQRFRLELENFKNLNHPNIIVIHDAGEHSGQYYFAMEPANGGSLAEQIAAGRWKIDARNSRDSQRAIARLMASIADAIHHAHLRGVLHRRLKPGNVLMDERDVPHLTDFGLTKSRPLNQEVTAPESGSPPSIASYEAPEQVGDDSRQLTAAADVYGLGAILYELLTGRPPFEAKSEDKLQRMVVHHEPRKPRAVNPLVDEVLEFICLKCLEKDPSKRPQSAGDVATQLKNWLAGRPIDWSRSGRAKKTRSGGRKLAWAAGLVVLAAVVVTVFVAASGWPWQEKLAAAATKSAFMVAFKRDDLAQPEKQTVGVSARVGDWQPPTPALTMTSTSPSTATSSLVLDSISTSTLALVSRPDPGPTSNVASISAPASTGLVEKEFSGLATNGSSASSPVKVLSSEEKFREAVRAILDNPPTNSATLATFGQALSSDLPWMAEALVSESVRLDSTNVQLVQQQAAMLKEHGKPARALEAIDSALQLPANGQNHQLWRLKGVILEDLGQSEKSLEAFSTALRIVETNTGIPDTVRAEYLQRRTALQERLAREKPAQTNFVQTNSPAPIARPTPAALDLSPYYTSTLDGETDKGRESPTANNLAALSSRVVRIDGIEFKVSGILQLANRQMSNDGSAFPKSVQQIRVGRTFTKLHLFHGTVWPAPPGTAVARVVIRYSDGDYAGRPIVYGEDVQELIYDPAHGLYAAKAKPAWITEERGLLALTAGKSRRAVWKPGATPDKDWRLIWYGSAEHLHSLWDGMEADKSTMRRWGSRLYRLKWTNPRPEAEVASMDFVSTTSSSAPFLLAATTE